MVILLRYASAFSEVIYADFCGKILDWNLGLISIPTRLKFGLKLMEITTKTKTKIQEF